MAAMDDLRDLLIHELQDLYDAEHRITKALPKMRKAAGADELKDAFASHLQETEGQIARLEQCFELLGEDATRKKCHGIIGLIEEGREEIEEDANQSVLDAALIGAAQKVEHYEIGSYGTARTHARLLGNDQVADLLQATLDEEAATDEKLTAIAEAGINDAAARGEDEENSDDRQSTRWAAASRGGSARKKSPARKKAKKAKTGSRKK